MGTYETWTRPKENCLSYWFPKIRDAGLPVPKTEIVRLDPALREPLFRLLDGVSDQKAQPFFEDVLVAVQTIGMPVFLRTGETSGKHNWNRTCYVTDAGKIESLTGKDASGKVVAEETVHSSNDAARITKEWTKSGLTVEVTRK